MIFGALFVTSYSKYCIDFQTAIQKTAFKLYFVISQRRLPTGEMFCLGKKTDSNRCVNAVEA